MLFHIEPGRRHDNYIPGLRPVRQPQRRWSDSLLLISMRLFDAWESDSCLIKESTHSIVNINIRSWGKSSAAAHGLKRSHSTRVCPGSNLSFFVLSFLYLENLFVCIWRFQMHQLTISTDQSQDEEDSRCDRKCSSSQMTNSYTNHVHFFLILS